jgi:DNA-binding MarR family transcriptional regulator
MDSNDLIRENILQYLYKLNDDSRSPESALTGIKKLQSELKKRHNYKQQEVARNINYLIDRNWVKKEVKQKDYTTEGGTTIHPESIKYRITAEGMEYIEGPSKFENKQIFSQINISNISGIVTLGNSNTIINQKYTQLFSELNILHRKILDNKKLNDEQRLNISSDIESLKNQLSKTHPENSIIQKLWAGICASVTLTEFTELLQKITHMIQSIF